MPKEKAKRNQTIDFSLEEGQKYADRALVLSQKATLEEIENRTICGNTMDVMPLLPEGFADLLIVDPPYNLSKEFHGSHFAKVKEDEYYAYTKKWLEAALPLLKPNATVYVCCDWRSGMVIGRVLQEYLHLQNRITWQREKGRGALTNWKNGMEDIWFATCSQSYQFNVDAVKQRRRVIAPYRRDGVAKDWEETAEGKFRNTFPSNFWDDISIPYWSMPENTAHPTQKPEKLLAKLILASSSPGDIVLDPFLGSGSTSVTAKKLGRRYVGIEQNPLYCAWAEKRLELAETDKTIQGYTDGVFWERNTGSLQKRKVRKDETLD